MSENVPLVNKKTMSFRGQNIKNIYAIDGTEYTKEQLTPKIEQKLGEKDMSEYSKFRLKVIDIVGSDGYATIKIYPNNRFEAFYDNGEEINIT